MKRFYYFPLFSLLCIHGLSAQERVVVLDVIQQEKLSISLGKPLYTDSGYELGATLSVSGGTPLYSYAWTPVTNLDNPLTENPLASSSEVTEYTVMVTDERECSCQASVNLVPNGIKELSQLGVQIFPNPATDQLYIYLPDGGENVNFQLINSLGVVVKQQMLNMTVPGSLGIDVSDCERGLYFLKLFWLGKAYVVVVLLK